MASSSTIVPAMPPPLGQTSNFVDPDFIGGKFVAVNCVFLSLAALSLGVRIWTRFFVVRNFRWDDCKS